MSNCQAKTKYTSGPPSRSISGRICLPVTFGPSHFLAIQQRKTNQSMKAILTNSKNGMSVITLKKGDGGYLHDMNTVIGGCITLIP